ncbi:F-type H+-transporting ATPase subunit b [Methylomarinovum tepidoasis]|uniref:ATP synthase subunit b n=1 Tax=Methylomarinovum tepidoasis TaxID=2840183 RepID=A0AAU9CCB5_9GAMM|nr:F0F1 ATP synthase subunit delta [Methylomarinovum sp. IN45]BCX89576.1 F-type H+-transporting ATPase subunit b [Methylomarinovum sp. IN45]
MGINWTTFFLEIVNFLVLVWLLKRFLYRPVKAMVARRRREVEARLAEAEKRRQEAEALKRRYENRLADWEAEKKRAWEQLRQELEAERRRRLQALEQELDEQRRKAEAVWEQEKREWRRHAEEQALQLGAAFAARLLERLADEHLHHRLVALLLEDLEKLPAEEQARIRSAASVTEPIQGVSAWPLTDAEIQKLNQVLSWILQSQTEMGFSVDPDLIAGVRIDVGAYVIRANLHDELGFFGHGHG